MTPFLFEDDDSVYPMDIWNPAIKKSLREINSTFRSGNGVIVDLAGGRGPLSDYVAKEDFDYIAVDKNFDSLEPSVRNHQKIVADITELPIATNSVDIAITITCLQYVDHRIFFEECHRILVDGGIIAIHENGAFNPFILFARFMQRCVGIFDWKVWRYRNTIVKYYKPIFCPRGFEVVYKSATCLITPLLFGLESIGVPCHRKALLATEKVDGFLLKSSALKKFAFFNVVHFRKISEFC